MKFLKKTFVVIIIYSEVSKNCFPAMSSGLQCLEADKNRKTLNLASVITKAVVLIDGAISVISR